MSENKIACPSTCGTTKGANFTAYETGAKKDWPAHTVELPGLTIPGKHFLKDMLGPVSYTHLDVYKRQYQCLDVPHLN